MRAIIHAMFLAASLLFGGTTDYSFAQTYPNKAVRMIVPFPPGGGADFLGRVVGQKLSEQLGQPVVVDNRAGASGNIGAELVAKAPSDGYTILMGALTSHSINYTLERKILRYDLKKDFVPITTIASVPPVLVVNPSVPARSLKELVAHAKAKPGQLSYGSSGAGSPQRLVAELFKLRTGVDMLHVPFQGTGPVIIAVIGGQVQLAFEAMTATLPQITAGKLRALAVTTAQRVPTLPDVPTATEAGLPNFEVSSTFGILAPANTPRPIVNRLNNELVKIVQLPEVKEKFLQQGAFSTPMSPEQSTQRIQNEIAMWAKVITDANIRSD
jgi:tripartite-type tricarboxylate transporter receptor subunit TctC